jgi:glyoxylase-like metal-dependent hydrolase (beta-lactamase superfamily II)
MAIEPQAIDTMMGGNAESTAAFLLRDEQTALVDTGPAASYPQTLAALEAAGVEELDWIVLTHIHLDHAGAAGHLAERFQDARVVAHERACGHLVNPERLYAGTRGVWGERTDSLLGVPKPVPADRLRLIGDRTEIDLGEGQLETIATPGHTRHHLSYLHSSSGAVICGDALGIRLPNSRLSRPGTPPTDFSLEDSQRSVARLRELQPTKLLLSHFGSATEREGAASVDAACADACEALARWSEVMGSEIVVGGSDVSERVERQLRAALGPDQQRAWDRLEEVNPTWLNVLGFEAEIDRHSG